MCHLSSLFTSENENVLIGVFAKKREKAVLSTFSETPVDVSFWAKNCSKKMKPCFNTFFTLGFSFQRGNDKKKTIFGAPVL